MAAMSSEKDRMLRGETYNTNDPELLLDRRQCRLLCERFNATSFGEPLARRQILTQILAEVGEDSEVMSPFECDYGYHISVGARTFINSGAVILDGAAVRIGRDVQIGPSVKLLTPFHPLDAEDRRRGLENVAPVTIGDGAWLATGVIVMPGVTIGANAVIGAGSVVTKDMPAGHLCFGNPCRVVREI
jgi:maltose O-acetyltransferase